MGGVSLYGKNQPMVMQLALGTIEKAESMYRFRLFVVSYGSAVVKGTISLKC